MSPAPIGVVTDFVNGWSSRVREAAGERDAAYPLLSEVLGDPVVTPLHASDTDLAELADRVHDIFSAEPPARRLRALNDMVRAIDPTPLVSPHGPRWRVSGKGLALHASLLFGLTEHARDDPGLERLGTCDAHRCVDVYADTSPAHTRRYCSLTCQNRAKAATFRRRRQGA